LAVTAVILIVVVGARYFLRPSTQVAQLHSAAPSPLYEPGDRPMTVFIKAVNVDDGKFVNLGVTIHESKDRSNQMKQTVLAYLSGPRTGQRQVPVPEGMALNEFYFTTTGAAVVDLSTGNVDREKTGFYDEALFVRGLIDTLNGNFFEIKQVKVLVEGQDQPTITGHYALGTSEASMPVSAVSNPATN
jgi:hypothetical protein